MTICETVDIAESFAQSLVDSGVGTIIFATALLVIAIAALLQIVGRLIGKAEYVELSKAELFQLLFSFLLIALTPLFFYFFSTIFCASFEMVMDSPGFSDGIDSNCMESSSSIADFGICAVREASYEAEQYIKQFMEKNIKWLRDARVLRTYYFLLKGSVTVGYNTHKAAYAIQYDLLNNLVLLPSLVSLRLQEIALSYGQPMALLALLPIGILFRIIRPLRDMGNAMYAVGFAIFALLPMLYAFNGLMYIYLKGSCNNYEPWVKDYVFGKTCESIGFWHTGVIAFSAVFLPNLAGVILAVFINGMYKVLKELG
ncbi:MAG: hypothetical protein QW035_04605 [Candidatus Anstonellales archaeon]